MKISYMTVLNGNINTVTVSKWGTDDWPLCWAKINYQNGMQWFRSSLDRRCKAIIKGHFIYESSSVE